MRRAPSPPSPPYAGLLVVLLAVACSSAGSSGDASDAGGGGTSAGAGAGGTGNPGGAGGATSLPVRPDPGTPPKSAVGILYLSSMQGNDGALKNQMNGLFLSPAKDLGLPDQQAVFTYYASIPIDTCTVPPSFSSMTGAMPTSVDAGVLKLTLPSGVTGTIGKMSIGPFTVYQQDLPADAFVPGVKYSVASSGAAVPAFSGDFYTPGDVTLTKPVLPAKSPAPVSLDADLELAWTGTPDGTDVFVQVKQGSTLLVCRLTDDGAFTLPKGTLAPFQATASTQGTDPDQLIVQKYTWYTVGDVLIEAASGMTLNIDLQ